MSSRSKKPSVTALCGLLFPLALCVFIALKLAGVTGWSWWWALSPLWIGAALLLAVAAALLLTFTLLALYARVRLRLRLRQAFPEVFIDPTAWSRIPADHSEDR